MWTGPAPQVFFTVFVGPVRSEIFGKCLHLGCERRRFSLPMILALGKKVQKDNLCKRPPFDAEATLFFLWDNGNNGAKYLAWCFEIHDGMNMG